MESESESRAVKGGMGWKMKHMVAVCDMEIVVCRMVVVVCWVVVDVCALEWIKNIKGEGGRN